jgi:menaquinone-dependent protoporphyrinogen IX oxidase
MLVKWISAHHDILQQKNNIILVIWVSEHHANTIMKEQDYAGKMDISTPWYISMKVQNYVGKMDMRTTMLYYNTCLFIYVLLLEI